MGLKECIIILKDMNYDSRVEFLNSIKADINDKVLINIWETAHRTIKKSEINALKTIVENPVYLRSLTKEGLDILKRQISNYIFSLSAENSIMGLNPDLPEVKENIKDVSELHKMINIINQEIEDKKAVVNIIKDDLGLKRH